MIDTSQKLHLADVQIESLKRSRQHAEITERLGYLQNSPN